MAAATHSVEIGFEGGQVVPVRLSEESLKELRGALESDRTWIDLDTAGTEAGSVAIDLERVLFLRISPGEHRVGF